MCLFKDNSSYGTGGGGARIGYIFFGGTHVKENAIAFESCKFFQNSAYFGGGASLHAAREPSASKPTNSLVFLSTTWEENVATTGSGADLSVWHPEPYGAVVIVNFTNCTFQDNTCSTYTANESTAVGRGARGLDPRVFHGRE